MSYTVVDVEKEDRLFIVVCHSLEMFGYQKTIILGTKIGDYGKNVGRVVDSKYLV